MKQVERPFDIILMGATGFTGQLVAGHLEAHAKNLNWAIAGRSLEKLNQVRDTVAPSAEVLVADSLSEADMEVIATGTRVVASTAGPFAEIGTQLVSACASHGTHYVDITGETQWIRSMIDNYHGTALETGARIIHCCGFDSIPSDLGVLLLAETLRQTASDIHILGVVTKLKGGMSGGTLASMRGVLKDARDRDIARLLRHPFSLNARPLPQLREPGDQLEACFIESLETWTTPFVMAAINTRIVRRSENLRGRAPTEMHYHETMRASSALKAKAAAASIKAGVVSQFFGVTRAVSSVFLPKQGQGPSAEERANGCFEFTLYGRPQSQSQFTHKVVVSADSDPGYSATAKMLGEAAICALNTEPSDAGVLTPAVGLGFPLVERLKAVGMRFEVTPLSV